MRCKVGSEPRGLGRGCHRPRRRLTIRGRMKHWSVIQRNVSKWHRVEGFESRCLSVQEGVWRGGRFQECDWRKGKGGGSGGLPLKQRTVCSVGRVLKRVLQRGSVSRLNERWRSAQLDLVCKAGWFFDFSKVDLETAEILLSAHTVNWLLTSPLPWQANTRPHAKFTWKFQNGLGNNRCKSPFCNGPHF